LRLAIAVITAASVAGQGTQPKAKPEDYPAHAMLPALSIGAENWGHGISIPSGSIVLNDYIAVEVALYADRKRSVAVSASQFTLRLNGRKSVLFPQAVGMVEASVKYPDWERHGEAVATAGSGDHEVIVGRRAPVERFPGDPRARSPLPSPLPGKVPGDDDPSVAKRQAPVKPEDLVRGAALPEGDLKMPVSGFLFFAYKGRLKSIKSMELIYDGPAGTAPVPLL